MICSPPSLSPPPLKRDIFFILSSENVQNCKKNKFAAIVFDFQLQQRKLDSCVKKFREFLQFKMGKKLKIVISKIRQKKFMNFSSFMDARSGVPSDMFDDTFIISWQCFFILCPISFTNMKVCIGKEYISIYLYSYVYVMTIVTLICT